MLTVNVVDMNKLSCKQAQILCQQNGDEDDDDEERNKKRR